MADGDGPAVSGVLPASDSAPQQPGRLRALRRFSLDDTMARIRRFTLTKSDDDHLSSRSRTKSKWMREHNKQLTLMVQGLAIALSASLVTLALVSAWILRPGHLEVQRCPSSSADADRTFTVPRAGNSAPNRLLAPPQPGSAPPFWRSLPPLARPCARCARFKPRVTRRRNDGGWGVGGNASTPTQCDGAAAQGARDERRS